MQRHCWHDQASCRIAFVHSVFNSVAAYIDTETPTASPTGAHQHWACLTKQAGCLHADMQALAQPYLPVYAAAKQQHTQPFWTSTTAAGPSQGATRLGQSSSLAQHTPRHVNIQSF